MACAVESITYTCKSGDPAADNIADCIRTTTTKAAGGEGDNQDDVDDPLGDSDKQDACQYGIDNASDAEKAKFKVFCDPDDVETGDYTYENGACYVETKTTTYDGSESPTFDI